MDLGDEASDDISETESEAGEPTREFRTDFKPSEDRRRKLLKLGDEKDIRKLLRGGESTSLGGFTGPELDKGSPIFKIMEPVPASAANDRRRTALRCSSMLCSVAAVSAWKGR